MRPISSSFKSIESFAQQISYLLVDSVLILQKIHWRSLCPCVGQNLLQHNANAIVVIAIIIASRGYFQKSDTNTMYMFLSPDVRSTCTKLELNVVYISSQRLLKSLSDEANSRQPKTQVRREELEM